jgi:CBS domain containing-hemolysin-like protein
MASTSDAGATPSVPKPTLIGRMRARLGLKTEQTLRSDIAGALAEPREATKDDFSPEERRLLRNILELRDVRVEDVMIPRAEIEAVEHSISIGDLLKIFQEARHSRLPVYRETLDDPVGMVHIRDFLSYLATGAPRITASGNRRRRKADEALGLDKIDVEHTLAQTRVVRPVLFVPPSMPALDLLQQMQATRVHMALVIDEYGGTYGLVSMEDLVEQIVGEIEDEHDEDETTIVASDDGWTAVARASLEDARLAIGEGFEAERLADMAEEVDTIGGLLVVLTGRVPARGELIRWNDLFEFEVLDADPRRVKRVRIRRVVPATPSANAATPADAAKPAA